MGLPKYSDSAVSPEIDDDRNIRVVVVGEPGCGKTTFIRGYYDHHSPAVCYSHNGVMVYRCEYLGDRKTNRMIIFKIPVDPFMSPVKRKSYYTGADVIVFVYAIDNPSSLQMLKEKWIPDAIDAIESKRKPVLFVGTKEDLRNDPQVIARLARENKCPVTYEEGQKMLDLIPDKAKVVKCSAHDLEDVRYAFRVIVDFVENRR